MGKQVAIRVNMEKDEEIDVLNAYLSKGYKVIFQSDVSQRLLDTISNQVYLSTILYILEIDIDKQ